MRNPGIGRSGGLTDWHLMNVADMWACLQSHHTDNHWRHVAGWRKVSELAGQHLGRLRAYRERLAQAWPPETNAASRAYLAKLDELIDQVQRTHDAAATNQTALSAATQALTSSRTQIQKIYEEYADKLHQKRSWEQIAADPKAAAASRTTQPPVSDSDLEQLNVQARGIMYGLSAELQQAQTQLRHPPAQSVRHGDRTSEFADPYPTGPAPVIPPIVPIARSTGTPWSTQLTSAPQPVLAPHTPRVGPVLGNGSLTPAVTNPRVSAPPLENEAAPPSGSRPSYFITPDARLGNPGRPETNPTPTSKPPTNFRNLTHGGLIGGPPGPGLTQPAPANDHPRRTSPIGGLIGGGAAGTAPAGGAGSRPASRNFPGHHNSPIVGLPGNSGGIGATPQYRGGHIPVVEGLRKWDPDHPWETKHGVEPVLRPPEDQGPIDPGPAIGFTK